MNSLLPFARTCLAATVSALITSSSVWAGNAEPSSPEFSPTRLLARLQFAAQHSNYQGTMVNNAGGVLSTTRVAHYLDGQQSFERMDALDGNQQQVYRQNGQVLTLWPQKHLAVFEYRDSRSGLLALPTVEEAGVEANYDVRVLGADRIAGREVQVLLLRPRDDFRFAQRIWADKRSGLMLRTDVLGARDDVMESSVFSEVQIGIKAQPEKVLRAMKRLDGYRVVRSTPESVPLEAEGWVLGAPVPGFRQLTCVKRQLDATGEGTVSTATVVQAVYSDGLTHVSLFIEPFDGQRHKRPQVSQTGATHMLMQRHTGDWWLTVVGDVPVQTLQHFAAALERRR